MLGKQRGFPLVKRLHQTWNYVASRNHNYFISTRTFAVLQMNLACSARLLQKMGWELVFEVRMRKIYVAVDCGSSESNWGFCVLE